MRILGRVVSPWWFLVIAMIGILALPGVSFLFFAANLLAGAVLGPPAIWSRPWHSPAPATLAGNYRESERLWSEGRIIKGHA